MTKTLVILALTVGVLLTLFNLIDVYFYHQSEIAALSASLKQSSPASSQPTPSIPLAPMSSKHFNPNKKCKGLTKWAVVVTDSITLSPAIMTFLNSTKDWCLLVLGMQHLSCSYLTTGINENNFIYIPRRGIDTLPYKLVSATPDSSFNQKNIGYLYAIDKGATVILDLEEDCIPYAVHKELVCNNRQQLQTIQVFAKDDKGKLMQPNVMKSYHVHFLPTDTGIWDPSTYNDADDNTWTKWLLQAEMKQNKGTQCIPIIQVYLPQSSTSYEDGKYGTEDVVVPRGMFSTYNAYSTTHLYEAFWSLLLPKTLQSNASAAWRSFIAQSLFYLIPDACLMFEYSRIESSTETCD